MEPRHLNMVTHIHGPGNISIIIILTQDHLHSFVMSCIYYHHHFPSQDIVSLFLLLRVKYISGQIGTTRRDLCSILQYSLFELVFVKTPENVNCTLSSPLFKQQEEVDENVLIQMNESI